MEKHTILVVDDDPTNLQIARDVLQKQYSLQLAISGDMALKFLARKKPDLILMDVMMPGMDGKETLKIIRENPANAEIPIVFLTANQSVEEEIQCLNLGASDFITKPIIPAILEKRIGRIIELDDFHKNLQERIAGKTSAEMRTHAQEARARQLARFKADGAQGLTCNADMGAREIQRHCRLTPGAETLLRLAMAEYNLSARAYARILKVARTIADLDAADDIAETHIGEAIQYRQLDRAL